MSVVATTVLSGPGGDVLIDDEHPFAIIGERINPTGRSELTDELKTGDMTSVQADALAQVRAGAAVLDLNAGIPGFDEPAMLSQVVKAVHEVVDVPLCIDSSTPEALEAAVPLAQGKVLINSVTAEAQSMERLLPLVKRFGAAVIGMANDEEGISMDSGERLAAARKIVEAAADHGIAREDVIIDPLTMPIGAAGDAATAMFETVRMIRDELGVNVSCGASNISFGMPDRQRIHAAFLTMAAMAGMNTAITNPLHKPVRSALLASDLLLGRDQFGSAWIADHRAQTGATSPSGS
jgi:5-methyltetrahydrofolate--homocysteine methyltransferase